MNFVDFLSKNCRLNIHTNCNGLWRGLNIEVRCYCDCHRKRGQASEVGQNSAAKRQHADAITQGGTLDDL